MSAITERRIEEEPRMASQANRELNNYLALSEKIAEDRKRGLLSEISSTLGHAWQGSGEIDAIKVLVDSITEAGQKERLNNVSLCSWWDSGCFEGSLNKMQPRVLWRIIVWEALYRLSESMKPFQFGYSFLYEWVWSI